MVGDEDPIGAAPGDALDDTEGGEEFGGGGAPLAGTFVAACFAFAFRLTPASFCTGGRSSRGCPSTHPSGTRTVSRRLSIATSKSAPACVSDGGVTWYSCVWLIDSEPVRPVECWRAWRGRRAMRLQGLEGKARNETASSFCDWQNP